MTPGDVRVRQLVLHFESRTDAPEGSEYGQC